MSKARGTLEILFESRARVKILKFLFRNVMPSFNAQELAIRIQEPTEVVSKEIKRFLEIGLLQVRK